MKLNDRSNGNRASDAFSFSRDSDELRCSVVDLIPVVSR